MVDRATRKTQVEAWVEEITASVIGAGDGIPAYWRGEPQPVKPLAFAICYLPTPVVVGIDASEHEYDAAEPRGSEMRHYQMGQRRITLDIQIRSSRTSGADDAGEYARRIVDRIRLDDWEEQLAAAGLAFASVATSTYIGEITDGREYTAHQLDLLFNATSLEEGSAVGYVETIDDAELEIPEGTTRWTGDIPVG